MARQTKITIRQDGLLILRGRSRSRAWCPDCRAEAEMIAVDRSTVISGTATPQFNVWLDGLDLHRVEGADGSPLICLKSLMGCVMNKKSS